MLLTAAQMDSPEQIAALLDGRIDAGLIRPRTSYPSMIDTREIHSEGLLLALSARHPLADTSSIMPADVAGEIFLIPQRNEATGLTAALSDLAAIGGYALPPTRDVSDFVTAVGVAAAGHAVILGPRSLANLAVPGIRYRAISGFDGTVSLALAWRKGNPVFETVSVYLAAHDPDRVQPVVSK